MCDWRDARVITAPLLRRIEVENSVFSKRKCLKRVLAEAHRLILHRVPVAQVWQALHPDVAPVLRYFCMNPRTITYRDFNIPQLCMHAL